MFSLFCNNEKLYDEISKDIISKNLSKYTISGYNEDVDTFIKEWKAGKDINVLFAELNSKKYSIGKIPHPVLFACFSDKNFKEETALKVLKFSTPMVSSIYLASTPFSCGPSIEYATDSIDTEPHLIFNIYKNPHLHFPQYTISKITGMYITSTFGTNDWNFILAETDNDDIIADAIKTDKFNQTQLHIIAKNKWLKPETRELAYDLIEEPDVTYGPDSAKDELIMSAIETMKDETLSVEDKRVAIGYITDATNQPSKYLTEYGEMQVAELACADIDASLLKTMQSYTWLSAIANNTKSSNTALYILSTAPKEFVFPENIFNLFDEDLIRPTIDNAIKDFCETLYKRRFAFADTANNIRNLLCMKNMCKKVSEDRVIELVDACCGCNCSTTSELQLLTATNPYLSFETHSKIQENAICYETEELSKTIVRLKEIGLREENLWKASCLISEVYKPMSTYIKLIEDQYVVTQEIGNMDITQEEARKICRAILSADTSGFTAPKNKMLIFIIEYIKSQPETNKNDVKNQKVKRWSDEKLMSILSDFTKKLEQIKTEVDYYIFVQDFGKLYLEVKNEAIKRKSGISL